MKPHFPFLLFILFLTTSCTKEDTGKVEFSAPETVEGTYLGYRSQHIGKNLATDSTRITLKVTRLADGRVQILQTSPNEFKYIVTMQGRGFTYDLGITEAACGAARLGGEGTFKDKELYLLETLECTRIPSASKAFTQLRAFKQ